MHEDSNLRHLVSYLARYQEELNNLRLKILAEENHAKAMDMLSMNWPIIQGMKTQNILKKIGELDIDDNKVGLAVTEITKDWSPCCKRPLIEKMGGWICSQCRVIVKRPGTF